MKKNQTILFDIPSPCQQDWDKMTKQEQGRHCELCNKVVVDFTNMSDEEVLHHFKKSKMNLCGRITNKQLDATPKWKYVSHAKTFLYAFAVIFFMGICEVGEAQVIAQSSDSVDRIDTNSISGWILDDNEKPITSSIVRFYCDGQEVLSTRSDSNGRFNCKGLKSGSYLVIARSVGYEQKTSSFFYLSDIDQVELKMKMKLKIEDEKIFIVGSMRTIRRLIDPSNPGRKIIEGEQIIHSTY